MKKIITWLVAVCMATSVFAGVNFVKKPKTVKAASEFGSNDFLKVNGTEIKNRSGSGNTVYLRGVNAGGLFVKEDWQNSTNAKDQKTELETLINRFGESTAYSMLEYYKDNFWTTSDFDKCAEMGMSVIRVPFTYMNIYKKSGNNWVVRDDAFTRLDWFVSECSKRGIYVILDLHGAFGSQNGQDHSGQVIDNVNDVTFFSNETYMTQTLDLWKLVATHYRGNPAVAAYDTLNEPGEKAGTTGEKHWSFYDRMYNAIRSVDPDHIVIMESCWGTGNLPNPSRYGWTNVVYEYHNYPWENLTDDNLDNLKSICNNFINSVNNANYGVPTYIGEFTVFEAWSGWQYWLEKYNQAGYHYTSWTYKTHYMGSWGIFNQKGTSKADIANGSEADIRAKWSDSTIGTGNKSKDGKVYNALKAAFPGTVTPLGGETVIPVAEGRHEAEDAIGFTKENSADEHKIEGSNNFSGGKAVGGMNCWPNDGRAYCTTQVKASQAGSYTMKIAYAGGEADHPCNIDVRVNGGNWVSTLAPVTPGWDQVQTITLNINLNQGVNTIDVTGACNIWYNGMGWEWINLDYFELTNNNPTTAAPTTTKAPTTVAPTTTAAPTTTKAPTTADPSIINVSNDLSIDGYQISYTVEGMRTVFTAANKVNGQNVVERGLVYGLADRINDSDLYATSPNAYVRTYTSTNKGNLGRNYSASIGNGTSYAMTMKFGSFTSTEFQTVWKVRAYAKLSNGAIAYSKVGQYQISDIASKLYADCLMQNEAGHNYLYNTILKKVNPFYGQITYNRSKSVV